MKWGHCPPPPTPAREGAHLPATCPVNPGSGGNPGRLPSAQAALAQDPAAEVPSESSVISVLLSCLRIHPESEQLLATVYGVLAIISSQGGCAWPSLSRAEAGALPGHGGVPAPDGARPALPSVGVTHAIVLFYLPTRSSHLTRSLVPSTNVHDTDWVPGATMGFTAVASALFISPEHLGSWSHQAGRP